MLGGRWIFALKEAAVVGVIVIVREVGKAVSVGKSNAMNPHIGSVPVFFCQDRRIAGEGFKSVMLPIGRKRQYAIHDHADVASHIDAISRPVHNPGKNLLGQGIIDGPRSRDFAPRAT
jgi:hypothetical protein